MGYGSGRRCHPTALLEDFLFLGWPGLGQCKVALEQALQVCGDLGILISEEKLEGPDTVITFLGIEMDSEMLQLCLPEVKLQCLLQTICSWEKRRVCMKREFLSLIGQLQHACRVVRSGRTFLRGMICLFTKARELHHHIRLNRCFQSDLQWWAVFLPVWNGICMMSSVCRLAPLV